MNTRTVSESIGQVFRVNGKRTTVIRVGQVSVCYTPGKELQLSRRDDYPSDEFVSLTISAAANYGVVIQQGEAQRSEDNTHGVRWCKVVWPLQTVKLDDVVNGMPDQLRPPAAAGAMTWDAARVKAANAKGTAANKRLMAEQPRMF